MSVSTADSDIPADILRSAAFIESTLDAAITTNAPVAPSATTSDTSHQLDDFVLIVNPTKKNPVSRAGIQKPKEHHTQQQHLQGDHDVPDGHQKTKSVEPHLVSRKPNKVIATSDVRGNLGPASVVIQAKPGTDWIHDRWQAASDMHGTQIRGAHWIQLEFQDATIVANKIILDWETAYADEYVIEGSLEPFVAEKEGTQNQVWTLFDGRTPTNVAEMRSVSESGQSPGVQEKRPLHIVHEIRLTQSTDAEINRVRLKPIRYLRLRILKSVTGWGVSLWQFDVYGFRASELQTS